MQEGYWLDKNDCYTCEELDAECPSCAGERLQEQKWDEEDNRQMDEAMGLVLENSPDIYDTHPIGQWALMGASEGE